MGRRPKRRTVSLTSGDGVRPYTEAPEPVNPERLGEHGAEYWKRIVPLLVERRTLTPLNLEALQTLCEAWDRYTTFRLWLLEDLERWTFKTKSGYPRPAPQVALMDSALKTLRELWVLFGLRPSVSVGASLQETARLKTIGDYESALPEIQSKMRADRKS